MRESQLYNKRWLAGFFDGEGNVGIEYTTNGTKSGNRIFRLRIGLAQKNLPLLLKLREKFGGYIKRSGCPQLHWCGKKAAVVLRFLLPYLIVKKDVALLGLEYQDIASRNNHFRLSQVEKKRRMHLRLAIQKLNHK